MKLSAYHKAKGDTVGFNLNNPDKIYQSIVFKKNIGKTLNKTLINIPVEYGGSGVSNKSKLPDNIELLKPDYDLYPSTYSQGFTTRGCNRDCYFCIVPDKEGKFKVRQHPKKFHDKRFKEIMIMDNNILFSRGWAENVLKWCNDRDLKVNMTSSHPIEIGGILNV